MLVVVASEMQLNGRMAAEGLALINVAVIVGFVLVASFWMLRFSDKVFAIVTPGRKPPSEVRAPVDQNLLKSLEAFMNAGGFRQSGLTIGGLADHLRAKEQGLRRVINGELGFRNFNAFLNSYRIREASVLLAAREPGRLPILTIAMDLGYGSIGPFNRAFKEATGKTPSEYRASFLFTQATEATPLR
jgi:AraC-like DNA-binding protein